MDSNQNPAPFQTEKDDQMYAAAKKKRKIILIILVVSGVIVLLSVLFSMIDPAQLAKKIVGTEEPAVTTEIEFYPADYDENIFENTTYADLDRRLFVYDPFSGVTYSVEEDKLEGESEVIRFFYYYIDAIIRGDALAYRNMFSPAYLAENELPDKFTMQMVYNITVYPELNDSGNISSYRIEYMIYRNNGTFRNDMGSDTIRAQRMKLVEIDGGFKINSVQTYKTYFSH